ncbi:hypothetical protein D3C85_1374100 [compost metagenome]
MARKDHWHRARSEDHPALQPGIGAPPVELAGVVKGLLKILRAGVEMLRVEHLDPALLGEANGPLDREGVAGHRKGIAAARLFEDL